MTPTSSIFIGGKLKQGIYRIQGLEFGCYLDIHKHSREVCCRERELQEGRGLWEITRLGVGYAIKMVEPGQPDQFCNPREGTSPATPLFVTAYPAAWRIERVDDLIHEGFNYVRFYWGPTKKTWDQPWGNPDLPESRRGKTVQLHEVHDKGVPWQTWILTPVPGRVEDTLTPLREDAPPTNGGEGTGPHHTRTQHAEYERDGFGTIVTEINTNTVITRNRYRVEDP